MSSLRHLYISSIGAYTAEALKRVLAWQIAQPIARDNLSEAEMARSVQTSRALLDRLLDPTVTAT